MSGERFLDKEFSRELVEESFSRGELEPGIPVNDGEVALIVGVRDELFEVALGALGVEFPTVATAFREEVHGGDIELEPVCGDVQAGDSLRLSKESVVVRVRLPTSNGVRVFYTVPGVLEEFVGSSDVVVIGGFSFVNSDGETVRFITGAMRAREFYRNLIAESSMPEFSELVEVLGWFFDPVRALGLALSVRGHWMLVDRPGAGKSTLLRCITVGTVIGGDYSEAALVYNMKEGVPGLLAREHGGFVGWDEISSIDEEKQGFVLTVLDGKAQRFKGAPIQFEHDCRLILSDNGIPEMPNEAKAVALVSRMQWIGGVLGEYQEDPQLFPEIVEPVKEEWVSKFRAVHLASYKGDWDRREVLEILGNFGEELQKEASKAFAKAVQNVIDQFPLIIDGREIMSDEEESVNLQQFGITSFAERCGKARNRLRLLRLAEMLYLFENELEDAVESYFSLTELETPKGDPEEKVVRAWITSLEHNYGDPEKVPPMKSALMEPLSEGDLETRFEDLV